MGDPVAAVLPDTLLTLAAAPDSGLTGALMARYGTWMTVSAVGEILWIPVYVLLLLTGFRDRTNPMPLLAMLAAIPLNFMFSFVCDLTDPKLCPHTPHGTAMDQVALWIWRLCFAFSVILLWQYFRYAREQAQDIAVPRRAAVPIMALGLPLVFALQYTFLGFEDDFNGNQLYFLMTIVISTGFVLLALARPDSRGHSYAAGWLRLLAETLMVLGVVVITVRAGTDAVSLYPGYAGAPHALVYVMAAAIVVLDVAYVAILAARRGATAARRRG